MEINRADSRPPHFRVLTEKQCRELYLAALECLRRVGVQVNQAEARQLLVEAGAKAEDNIIRIPPRIIQEALEKAPRSFSLWGRDRQSSIQVTPGKVHFGPGPTCTHFIDPETGARRKAQQGDAGLTARVCDGLPNVDYAMSLCLFDDVVPVLSPVYEFAEMIVNTTKPVIAWANDLETLSDIYRIASTVAGGEDHLRKQPSFAYFTCYESPLRHPQGPITNLLWAAEHGIPVVYLGGPTVGLESPFTGASALVIYLATVLSGLAIVQLKHPGAPMVLGGVLSVMDLRTARPAYGSPEMSLYSAAAAELTQYLGLPFMGTAGASESKLLDSQAAIESTLQVLLSSFSGASLIHDMGFLDCADIGSLHLLVMVDEIIGMVKRIMRGIQVDQEAILLELIEQIGPGGNFITEPQSVSLCRKETWVPQLMDRNAYLIWAQAGSKSMEARVKDKLEKILKTHQPAPLPGGVVEAIDAILEQAELREKRSVTS